ncbi:MAG: response regulator [Nitrospina sp.]|nr:response regulator [Nitrospina sp.]
MQTPPAILVADDDAASRELIEIILSSENYHIVTAQNGNEVLELIRQTPVDLILLDVLMPGMTGMEVCRKLKSDPEFQLIPIIFLTALDQMEDRVESFDLGVNEFMSKPFSPPELLARVKSLLKIKSLTDSLESAFNVVITLGGLVEARDPYTGGHISRVCSIALKLANMLGLSAGETEELEIGCRLHDIGKIGIPDTVLLKEGKLTREEFDVIRTHSKTGFDLCKELDSLGKARDIILNHHEKLDGSGYPNGIKGDAISLPVRIATVSDIFDALTSNRCYRPGLSPKDAFEIMGRDAKENKIDEDVFNSLVACYQT